jgi:hypothetical protein
MNFKAIFLLGILGIPLNTVPMGGASRIGNFMRQNGQKIIPYSLYTGAVAGLGLDICSSKAQTFEFDTEHKIQMFARNSRNEIREIEPFIEKECQVAHVDFNKLKIVSGTMIDDSSWSTYNNFLLFDRDDCEKAKLINASKESQPTEKEILRQQGIKAVLHHELGHYKAEDVKRKFLLSEGMQTGSLMSLGALCARIPSKKIQSLAVAVIGFPLYAFNRIIGNAYSRHREALADECIPQKVEYLQGIISFFEKAFIKERKAIQKGASDIHNANSFAYYWHAGHPTMISRIDRFKERLELLEKEEAKQINK